NHDVDWKVMKLNAKSLLRFGQRYDPFTTNSKYSQLNQGKFNQLLRPPYFVTCDYPDLQVLCINSAAVDGPDEQIHRGHIDQDALKLISEELNLWPKDTR